MSYYWFNREKILKNAWDKYHNKGGKEKAAKYYAANQEVLKEDSRNRYRNLSKKEKDKKKKYQKERYCMNIDLDEKLKQYRRNYYASVISSDIVVNKKEFQAYEQATAVNLVDTNEIVVSGKFKYGDNGSKYFIGYLDEDIIIRALFIILPQMSGCIKYFNGGGKNMSFKIEDESVFF